MEVEEALALLRDLTAEHGQESALAVVEEALMAPDADGWIDPRTCAHPEVRGGFCRRCGLVQGDRCPEAVVEAIMDAQAELQTGLGLMRLLLAPGEEPYSDSELIPRVRALDQGYFAKTLAWLHTVLAEVGTPMYSPATHPDVPATLG